MIRSFRGVDQVGSIGNKGFLSDDAGKGFDPDVSAFSVHCFTVQLLRLPQVGREDSGLINQELFAAQNVSLLGLKIINSPTLGSCEK